MAYLLYELSPAFSRVTATVSNTLGVIFAHNGKSDPQFLSTKDFRDAKDEKVQIPLKDGDLAPLVAFVSEGPLALLGDTGL
jgi:hypothetical protein